MRNENMSCVSSWALFTKPTGFIGSDGKKDMLQTERGQRTLTAFSLSGTVLSVIPILLDLSKNKL